MKKQQSQPPPQQQPIQTKTIENKILRQSYSFWTYLPYDEVSDVLEHYLNSNQKDIYTMQNSGGYFLDQMKIVMQHINGHIHPVFVKYINPEEVLIRFNNIKVDYLNLKLFQIFQNNSQIEVIDFRSNELNQKELDVIYQISSNQKISKLFIEYNPLVQPIKLASFYNISFLYLRGNNINDQKIIEFINNAHSQLKVLELGDNSITRIGCDAIAQYLQKQNTLEYLGLGRNKINNFNEIRELSTCFGKIRLTNEEINKIQELEAQREAQIAKFQKTKKKYTEEMLIQIPSYLKVETTYYRLLNQQFKLLNLADNLLPENDRDHVDKFMGKQLDSFVLILYNNPFENSTKGKWRKKFKKNLLI